MMPLAARAPCATMADSSGAGQALAAHTLLNQNKTIQDTIKTMEVLTISPYFYFLIVDTRTTPIFSGSS
jgi:hypothetical protein